jgi:hypothetical protein
MTTSRTFAVLASALASSLTLAAQTPGPAPTPAGAEQHVTVPSLPGQDNREGTVRPDNAMPTDSAGYVRSNPQSADRPDAMTSPPAGTPQPGPGAPAPRVSSRRASAPAPTKAPVITTKRSSAPSYMSVRGTVQSVKLGKSLTLKLHTTGKLLTYTIDDKADVPADLAKGQDVTVRVKVGVKGRVTDKVERTPKG